MSLLDVSSERLAGDLQTVLTTLSVDASKPLWHCTGLELDVVSMESVTNIARHLYRELHAEADSPYLINYSLDHALPIRDEFWRRTSASLTTADFESLARWIDRLLTAINEKDWYREALLCLQLVNSPLRGYDSLFIDRSERNKVLKSIDQHLRRKDDIALKAQAKIAISDWDRSLFKTHLDTGPPTNGISLLLLRHRYEELVVSLKAGLSAPSYIAFSRWLADSARQDG